MRMEHLHFCGKNAGRTYKINAKVQFEILIENNKKFTKLYKKDISNTVNLETDP